MDELIDDDDFLDDFDTDYGNIRFERVGIGQYLVAGSLTINGRRHERKVRCVNPAFGFARLGEAIDELLTAEFRGQHQRPARPDSRDQSKAPPRKKRQAAEE
jgi:hypothetical protein